MASDAAAISHSREGARLQNPVFDMAPFALPSAFWNPSYTRGSLWLEHLPFCFWAVEAARPSTMVITGTADGVPHFALGEAVLRLRLETQCLAILQDQPSTEIAAYNEENFCGFSRIEVASGRDVFTVAPSGIDLLVLADHGLERGNLDDLWEAWLPKLSERAVVLIPRIEESSDAAGGWNRIRNEHPHHVFHHGGGMGVVGVGSALPELFHYLFNLKDGRHSALVRAMFARLGAAVAESHRHAAAKRSMQKAETRSGKLEEAVRTAVASRDAAQKELTNARARADTLQAELEASQQRYKSAQEQLDEVSAKLEKTGRELLKSKEQHAAISHELLHAQARLEELESEMLSTSRALKLRTEHSERVAAAVEALKQDHEANKTRLFEARRLAARAEAESRRNVDRLRADLKRAEQRIRGIKGEAAGFRKKLKRERELHQRTRNELDRVLGSRSWALTAPFRKMVAWIRRPT